MAYRNDLNSRPGTVAELGPGDSLGVGLAAMLTGTNRYQALDVERHASPERNLEIFDALVKLLADRTAIPNEVEFPRAHSHLASYEFPGQVLTKDRLARALRPERIEAIRNALRDPRSGGDNGIEISYHVPWYDPKVVRKHSVDTIFSQAALEHVEDVSHTYYSLWRWLRPGGFMSHQIDFRCHGHAEFWNGNWAYSDLTWKLMMGNRGYSLNRQPHSAHLRCMMEYGFRVVCDMKTTDASRIARRKLAPRFSTISDEDLVTSSAFILAVKPASC